MFIGNSIKDPDVSISRQESINYYIESQGEGARNTKVLIGAQGTESWTTVGSGPIKAIHNHNERLYCVSGIEFYEILSDGSSILRGTLLETNQPFIVSNLTQVVVINGVNGYVWDETTELFTQISSPNFYPTSYGCYQDGYMFFVRDGTGQFFVSAIDDALTYNAIDFDEAILRGDNLLSIVSDTRNVWLVGERTTEPWYNNGQLTGAPIVPTRGAASLRGAAAKYSVVSSQIGLFFLGDDHNVYWMQQYTAKNISTDAQAKELTSYPDLSDAFAFMMNIDGHWFYVLTLPTQKRTFVFDPEENAWHNRESRNLGYWRAACYEQCFGYNLVGDLLSNKIGKLKRDCYQEYGDYWVSKRITGVYSARQKLLSFNRLELVFASGFVAPNVDHIASLRISGNRGMTFGNPRQQRIGKMGNGRIRPIWHAVGSYRDVVFELSVSTNGNRDLLEEDIEVEIGGN